MKRAWLPRNRLLRAVVILSFIAVALELVYVVAGSIALAVVAKKFDANAPVGVAFDRGFTWFPGRVHLHGVRVHGAGAGAWSVAISDANVAFTPWGIAASPRRIDSVTADVTSVDLGDRRSKGAIHVVATDITIDDPRVAFHVDANVTGATLETTAQLANDVHGSIALDVAPVDLAHHSMLETASGKVALDGVFLSLAPLASFGSLATTQDPGTLHVAGTLDKGLLAPSSEIRAHTAHATLADDHGASAAFPRGVDVVVRVAPASPKDLQLAVETPSLVFGGADPSKPADAFDDFEMSVPAGSSDLKQDHLEMRSLDWSSKHATMHEGATTLSAVVSGHLHFQVRTDGELVADSGFMHGANVTVENPDAPDRTPFDARLVIERIAVTRAHGIAIRGPLHASGADARPLLEVLVTSENVRKSVGGAVAHKAFTLDTTLDRDDGHLSMDDFVLHAPPLKLRGGYRRRDATARGAFVLEDSVLPVGILLHDKTESIVLGATSSWLQHQLEAE